MQLVQQLLHYCIRIRPLAVRQMSSSGGQARSGLTGPGGRSSHAVHPDLQLQILAY
jgi:hypothetical protein